MNFVNLHNHSHYSILDGLGKPKQYIHRAVDIGQPAVALTDHGSLSGIYQLWKASQGTGVKPIAGCEFYIAPDSRHRKEPVYFGKENQRGSDISRSGSYGHITVVARDIEGLCNLYRLQEIAYREGFYSKPRVDLEVLHQNRKGLICLTGCASGILATRLRLNQRTEAIKHLQQLKDIFEEDVFVELMYHGIVAEDGFDELALNHDLISVANECDVSTVATNDAHYCYASDSAVHDALLCIQTHKKLSDDSRFSFNGSGYNIVSFDDMNTAFVLTDLPVSAISRTVDIADSVTSYDDLFRSRSRMPKWQSDISSDEELEGRTTHWCIENGVGEEYIRRMEYEISTITGLGFADYFLVLSDILAEARSNGIRIGPARGSAGGSLVAYATGIQSLDPLHSGLLFERFLNPERRGFPDIDVDIQEDQREKVLEIARKHHGGEYVAAIGTYDNIKAKAALKDSARVLGHSYQDSEAYTRYVPRPTPTYQPQLSDYTGDKTDEVYKLAVKLEGTIRAESVHPAAIVISPEPLKDAVPLRYPSGKGNAVVCLDMHEIEELGFVKIDFLGLRTLKVIDDCLSMLERRSQEVVAVESGSSALPDARGETSRQLRLPTLLPTEPRECTDPATYALLASGRTLGVFQLDGDGMRRLLRNVSPESFGDVAAVLALYRPGPMGAEADRSYAARKAGRERISYVHPDLQETLAPILDETYGLIVYQEQVLEILAAVGGYTYGSAELIFNAMRKKQLEKMEAAKPDFASRMTERGYSTEAIEALWEVLIPFAGYSFNKAHSYGYGLLSYWTAYLKANYPMVFMSVLLSNETDNAKKADYLNECAALDIKILPPDINTSNYDFTATDDGIRYGLYSIKGVGKKAIEKIFSIRPFKNLDDFYRRAPDSAINSGVLSALIRSGALDGLASRESHMKRYEEFADRARNIRAMQKKGQRGVVKTKFSVKDTPVSLPKRKQWEKETVGVELSVSRVIIKPHQVLPPGAIVWLKKTLESYPGRQPVYLDLGTPTPIDTERRVDLKRAQQSIESLGVTIKEVAD